MDEGPKRGTNLMKTTSRVIRRYTDRSTATLRDNPSQLVGKTIVLVLLSISSLFFVAPLYWLFVAAFRSPGTLSFPPDLVPTTVGIHHFVTLVTTTKFINTYFVNSLVVSGATVLLTVTLATTAGYALSRYALPYERIILASLLGLQITPILAMLIPLYRLFAVVGLLDTIIVVIIADTVLAVPIATWIIKGQFDTVPTSIEEAARVGGASRWQTFTILVPLARPAIGTAGIYAFVVSWNQFVIPLTFTSSQQVWTYPLGLFEFISRRGVVDWGLLGAASLLAMLPVIVLFVVFQQQFLEGLIGTGKRGR